MTQNLIDLDLSAEALAEIDAALDVLETRLSALIGLTPELRRELTKMGNKSEAFCREAVTAFQKNIEVLPRNFDVGEYVRDLTALDALRERRVRLDRLQERVLDSEMALGSDLMVNSLEGYAVLKVAGKGAGLDTLRQLLSVRFGRARATGGEVPADAPAPA
jgi:hypothetical protein